MKNLLWFLPFLVVLVGFVACSRLHTDRIDLESALHNTEDGRYSLIVMADEFVSFQPGAYGKKQYYYDKTKAEEILRRIKKSVVEAQRRGHIVHFEDIRNGSVNNSLHPTSGAGSLSSEFTLGNRPAVG